MLFMVTQIHTPESCPINKGGADILIDKGFHGVTMKGRWGAWTAHTIWYLLEANSADAIEKFLEPGMTRCSATVTPVSESLPTGSSAAPRRRTARK